MKNTRRIFIFALVLVMATSILAIPTMAAMVDDDFPHFPYLKSEYGNTYMAAAVAAQKFLMEYDEGFAERLSDSGGTDGRFGATSAAVTYDFQVENWLTYKDGEVGSETWQAFADEMIDEVVPNQGLVYAIGRVYPTMPTTWIIVANAGYRAVTEGGSKTSIFYPY